MAYVCLADFVEGVVRFVLIFPTVISSIYPTAPEGNLCVFTIKVVVSNEFTILTL